MNEPVDLAQRRVAARLARCGVGAGDRVVVLDRNRPAYLDVTLGCLRAGVVPVPLDPHLAPAALAELVHDADPALVITGPDLGHLVPPGRRHEVADGDWPAERPLAELSPWPLTRPMHYTSGTTGRSKGVHAGMLGPDAGRALSEDERAAWHFDAGEVHLVVSPLHHSAPHRFAANTLLYGGRAVLLGSFDAGAVLRAVEQEGVTSMFVVPTHLARLLDHPSFAATDLSSLRWVAHAGAPCPQPLKRRALQELPAGTLREFYGATEGQFTSIGPDEWLERPGSVGRARTGRTLSVHDDDGREVAPGTVGTVYSSAPPFARFTYWRDEQATARAWRASPDGVERFWRFTVGDDGYLDADGYLYLTGRRTDLILSGGVNVYPAQVERVLTAHPAVLEGAVFGRPDDEWGQRVCAAVVLRPGASLDTAELRAWLRQRLAGFQTPKEIDVIDALPRTATGKIRRGALPDLLGQDR
jgi:long-chain acyl-CoA synthetase